MITEIILLVSYINKSCGYSLDDLCRGFTSTPASCLTKEMTTKFHPLSSNFPPELAYQVSSNTEACTYSRRHNFWQTKGSRSFGLPWFSYQLRFGLPRHSPCLFHCSLVVWLLLVCWHREQIWQLCLPAEERIKLHKKLAIDMKPVDLMIFFKTSYKIFLKLYQC